MELGESKEDYLEAIYILSKSGRNPVRGVDVAEALSISKTSVCLAGKKLAELGYLDYDKNHEFILTNKGKALGGKIYERHQFWNKFLLKIGVSEEIAGSDACRIEHVLSDESYGKLKNFLNQVESLL